MQLHKVQSHIRWCRERWKNACHVSRRRGICTDGRQRPAVSSLLMPAEPAHQEQHKTHTPNSTPRHAAGRGPGAVTGRRFKWCTKHTELEAETLKRKLITTIVMLIISDWSFRFVLPTTSKKKLFIGISALCIPPPVSCCRKRTRRCFGDPTAPPETKTEGKK